MRKLLSFPLIYSFKKRLCIEFSADRLLNFASGSSSVPPSSYVFQATNRPHNLTHLCILTPLFSSHGNHLRLFFASHFGTTYLSILGSSTNMLLISLYIVSLIMEGYFGILKTTMITVMDPGPTGPITYWTLPTLCIGRDCFSASFMLDLYLLF